MEIILEKYSGLNKAEKRVAEIAQRDPGGVIKMTIKELAKLADTSETTVFRFCDKLGYTGFSEFKINLALGMYDKEKELHSEISKDDVPYTVAQKMLNSYINSAQKTIDDLDITHIEAIAEVVKKANALYFFGMGGSYSIANDARHKFIRLNQNTFAEADPHWQTLLVATGRENDVCILISNSGSNKDLIEQIPYFKSKGLITVGISSSASTPLAQATDYHLVAHEEGARFVTEAMESRQTTMLLLDILFVIVGLETMDKIEDDLHHIRQGIAKRRI